MMKTRLIHSNYMKYKKTLFLFVFIIFQLVIITPVQANQAQVIEVKINALGNGTYRIDTTLQHADTGWKHYANAWFVYDTSGRLLGERILHHPHVDEQPFTRSLTLKIPSTIKDIVIKAQDSVHGLNEQGKTVEVPN